MKNDLERAKRIEECLNTKGFYEESGWFDLFYERMKTAENKLTSFCENKTTGEKT